MSSFGIVIPTRNEERNLARLLKSIRDQTNPDYSIVVVDQASNDRTLDIARSHGCVIIQTPRPRFYSPPGRARNLGANAVKSRILIHLDADMELGGRDFLDRVDSIIDAHHAALIIPEVDVASGFWSRCKALERACYRGSSLESARAVTQELFDAVGGYDEEVSSGEDFVITARYRRKTTVVTDDGVWVRHHLGRQSLSQLLAKKVQYGKTARIYLRKAREVGAKSGSSLAGSSFLAYVSNWRLLKSQPLEYICILPMRFLEVLALLLGMAISTTSQQVETGAAPE